MRVLGIDPGSRVLGWGVVEQDGARARAIAHGVLRLSAKSALQVRLREIYDGLQAIIATHSPSVMAVEDLFFAKHADAALKLGHARGVVLLVANLAELEVCSYPPALVKRSIAGRGQADKTQIARVVAAMVGLKTLPAADATDAIAVALTHLSAARTRPLVGALESRSRRAKAQ